MHSKYNVNLDRSMRSYDGIVFDSRLEMTFYRDWIMPRKESGEIVDCKRQVKYILQDKFMHNGKTILPITYVADFVVTFSDGRQIIYDTKGTADSTMLLKRKLFWRRYPDLKYEWVSYTKKTGWVSFEQLKAIRNKNKKSREGIKNA